MKINFKNLSIESEDKHCYVSLHPLGLCPITLASQRVTKNYCVH